MQPHSYTQRRIRNYESMRPRIIHKKQPVDWRKFDEITEYDFMIQTSANAIDKDADFSSLIGD